MLKTTSKRLRRRLALAFAAMLVMAAAPVFVPHSTTAKSETVAAGKRVVVFEVTLTAAIGQTSTTIGIADSNLYGLSPADVNTTLDHLSQMGVKDVRILIPWAFVEPLPGVYDWSRVDMIVNAANARGMGVLGDITSAPPLWAAQPGTPPYSGAPANPAQYASFAGTVAGRYAGQVAAYQVWNEENSAVAWIGPNGGPDAQAYTQLLKAAYPAIKAADPNAQVIAGGLVSVVSAGNLTVDPVTFVQQMYANGAKGYFDALAFHPYQYTLMFSQGTPYPISPISQLDQIRQLMVANGDGSKQVWTTEYGEPSAPAGEANQAAYISDFLNTWKTLSYAGPAFIYTTRDNDSSSTNPDDTLGIFRTDWTPKQAVQVITDFIAANQPADPPPVGDPPADPFAAFFQALAQALATALQQAFASAVQQAAQAIVTGLANAISAWLGSFANPPAAPAAQQVAAASTVSSNLAASSGAPDSGAANQQPAKSDGTDSATAHVVTAAAGSDTATAATDHAKPQAVDAATAASKPAGTAESAQPASKPTTGDTAAAATTPAAPEGDQKTGNEQSTTDANSVTTNSQSSNGANAATTNTTNTANRQPSNGANAATTNGQSSTGGNSGSSKTDNGQSSSSKKGTKPGTRERDSKKSASSSESTQVGASVDGGRGTAHRANGSDSGTASSNSESAAATQNGKH